VGFVRVTCVHVLRRGSRGSRDRDIGRKRVWGRFIPSINVCLRRKRWCSVVRNALRRDIAKGWANIGVDQVHPVEQLRRGKVKVPAGGIHSGTEYTILAGYVRGSITIHRSVMDEATSVTVPASLTEVAWSTVITYQ